jgi:hypothetical protein
MGILPTKVKIFFVLPNDGLIKERLKQLKKAQED